MKKIICLIIILLLSGCKTFETSYSKEDKFLEIFNLIEEVAYIKDYTIYGRYFNLSGEIEGEFEDLVLVLKNDSVENEYKLNLEITNDKTIFKTNKLINEGINLEYINEGEYAWFLKSQDTYYSLENKTSYDDLNYYTVTKDNQNRKIEISFSKFNDKSILSLNSKVTSLPDNVYDIVIDPGHGGVDSGASKNGYFESHINLDYAKLLKEALESLGLKVKLTRDDNSYIPNYGENSRVSIPYLTKAKLMLSIHMNSAVKNVGDGGVEVYVPYNSNTKFASNLAKNIVDNTSTIYSNNTFCKIDRGVYLRTLSKSDLEEIQKDAIKDGYTPYEKATLNSTYYYIIRETGGVVTGAYVDSRNKEKPWNTYYNSNHGCESYLLELGYMNSTKNLNILLKEENKYVEAIVKSIKEYLEI